MSQRGRNFQIPTGTIESGADREVAEIIRRSIQNSPFLNFEGKLLTIGNDTGKLGEVTIPHGMSFRPIDAILVSSTYPQGVYFRFEKFTDKTVTLYLSSLSRRNRILVGIFRG